MAGEAEQREIFSMIEHIQQETMNLRLEGEDHDINKSAKLACALVMFAGSITGELFACGLLTPDQLEQATASATRNFLGGIEAGVNKISRLAQQHRMVN